MGVRDVPYKFDPKKVHKLDDPERRKVLPPEETLQLLGVRPGMTVVDLGCGSGYFSLPAARLVGEAGRVYGVDLYQELLDLCRQRAEEQGIGNFVPVLAEEVRVPLPGGEADAVLAVNVLHEFEDLQSSLFEMRRLLKPEGRLLVVDWQKVEMEMGPPVHARIAPQEARELLERGGFTTIKTVQPGPCHYGLIAHPSGTGSA